MTELLSWIAILALGAQAIIGLAYWIASVTERETRASVFAALQFFAMLVPLGLFIFWKTSRFFETPVGLKVLVIFLILSALGVFLLSRKSLPNAKALEGTRGHVAGAVQRFDERDQVFARNRSLPPGSEQYRLYYQARPQNEGYDTQRRQRGGPLGQAGTIDKPNDRPNVAASLASLTIPMHLSTPEKFSPQTHPNLAKQQVNLTPMDATARIKGYIRSLGAELVGVTAINPLWIYSRRGEIFHNNWAEWGQAIELDHKYAVVFASEMAFEMVSTAPHTPTTIESMVNYAKGAYIATQLAAYIANFGYAATANHVRHYDLLLVPLAVDAGLGQVGRLGYLLTAAFGPRVRLGAVTTNMELVPDKPVDIGVEDFCRACKKCALCCPSSSIPQGELSEVNGTLRWKLNAETCFDYWGKVGTDCNICMRVCPWSHASTFPHRIIRSLITRNAPSRRLFAVMDDIFYGRRPKPKGAPRWARFDAYGSP
jgi:reductive dehalogenase